MPLKLELATELRLERPLSLAEVGEVCDGESRPRSSLTAESGLSGSGSELFMLTLALFLAALFRKERREFSICERHTNMHEAKSYKRSQTSPCWTSRLCTHAFNT